MIRRNEIVIFVTLIFIIIFCTTGLIYLNNYYKDNTQLISVYNDKQINEVKKIAFKALTPDVLSGFSGDYANSQIGRFVLTKEFKNIPPFNGDCYERYAGKGVYVVTFRYKENGKYLSYIVYIDEQTKRVIGIRRWYVYSN